MSFSIRTLLAFAFCLSFSDAYPTVDSQQKLWPGFDGLKSLFVFGDSYSQTGFLYNGTQPSPSNPMGNPAYPGYTSSNGPNWVGFLTTTYNASLLQTYNLAIGGATVDAAYVKPYTDSVHSIAQQVADDYLPNYTSASDKPWEAATTLYAFWVGVNDCSSLMWQGNRSAIADRIFATYSRAAEQVHESGGRNFVFLTVPPMQFSPQVQDLAKQNPQGKVVDDEKATILDWNERVGKMAAGLEAKGGDTTAFMFDAYGVFEKALKDPKTFEQTKGLKNTTTFCAEYEGGVTPSSTVKPSCGVAADEYFWLNQLHPTSPIHNAIAANLAEFLAKGKQAAKRTSPVRRTNVFSDRWI
ncbi:carbohydrate esterase family 16 protein [Aulographum hederae CBS 113979]|uniref:Carbohydrate esterase family 16 protein n=1 Tax=Aulographum hederae CBS 113979 TaxID=1176131 RepID=A0A6G1HHT8_9PEZI|nr:carbohydrate esterase family 16 protein [Aulographum hederae CBS 113979]